MAKYQNEVVYNIKTTFDQTGLSQLQSQIQQTQVKLNTMANSNMINPAKAQAAIGELTKLQKVLQSSFNSSLGMIDMSKITAAFSNGTLEVGKLSQAFKYAGAQGTATFNNLLNTMMKFNTYTKSTSVALQKVWNTVGNTVRWGLIATAFQAIMSSVSETVSYMKELDSSLTNIMLVTDYTKDDMREFAQYANEAAQALGTTTTAYTDAALIFAQQGFDLSTASTLGEYSIKLANVTGQDTSTTSDQLTSYMNAYDLDDDMSQLSLALDKWAMVANVSAADVEELSVATQKAGSTAATVGVNLDQLAAEIATIESVTRDAPENIGNGLKTIYARLADLQMGETTDDGVSLGSLSGTLENMGVSVLDQSTGAMRNMGDIIEDLMKVWQTLDTGQKEAAAVKLAGKYQMNRFMTLMENADMYNTYKSASEDAEGTLDTMQAEYLDSLQGKLDTLSASIEGIWTDLFNQDDFGVIIERLTNVVNLFDQFIESVGGAKPVLTALGALSVKVFDKQISQSIMKVVTNHQKDVLAKQNELQISKLLADSGFSKLAKSVDEYSESLREQAKALVEAHQAGLISDEDFQQRKDAYTQEVQAINELSEAKEEYNKRVSATNAAYKLAGASEEDVIKDNGDISEFNRMQDDNALLIAKQIKSLDWDKLQQPIDKLQNKIISFHNIVQKNGTPTKKAITDVKVALSDLTKVNEFSGADLFNFTDLLDELKQTKPEDASDLIDTIQQYINDIDSIKSSDVFKNPEEAMKSQNEVYAKQNEANSQKEAGEGQKNQLNLAEQIKSITDMTAAIGQLSYAWQSFQNLGSIWSDTTLSDGEKLTQTITNLTTALPMLITGVQALTKGFQEMWASQTANAFAATTLGGALKTLTTSVPWLLAITVVLGAITSLITSYFDGIEKAQQAALDSADAAAENTKALQEEKEAFDDLYDSYKNGSASSDDLQSSAEELNDTLQDQKLKIYAAAGAWDEYQKRLQEVSDEKFKADKVELGLGIDTVNQKMIGSNLMSLAGEYSGQYEYGPEGDGYSTITDTGEAVSILKEKKEEYTNLVSQYEAMLGTITDKSSSRYQELQQKLTNAKSSLNTINSTLSENSELVGQYEEYISSLAAQELTVYKNQEEYQYQIGESTAAYMARLQNTEMYQSWVASKGEDAANNLLEQFVEGMATADVDGSSALATTRANEASSEQTFGYVDNSSAISNLNAEIKSLEKQKQKLEESGDTSEEAKEKLKKWTEEIEKNRKQVTRLSDAQDKNNEIIRKKQEGYNSLKKILPTVINLSKQYQEALKNGEDTDDVFSGNEDTMSQLKESYKNMMNIQDDSILTNEFMMNNLGALQDVYNNVDGAYEKLSNTINTTSWDKTQENINNAKSSLVSYVNELGEVEYKVVSATEKIDALNKIGDLTLNADMNTEEFDTNLQQLVTDAGLTAQQVQSKLGNGWHLVYEEEPGFLDRIQAFLSGKDIGTYMLEAGKARFEQIEGSSTGTSSSGGSGGSGGSGDGDGSGSGSNKEAKHLEYDRYEKVNNELDKTSSRYDKLSSQQENLSGSALTENLLKQNNLLSDQIDLLEEKAKIQKEEQEELKNELTGYGVQFDEDGIITNWKDIVDQLNAEGDAIAASGDEDALDAWEEKKDAIEEAYERWNELDDEIIDTESEMIEKTNEITENIFAGYNTIIEFADALDEMNDTLDEFEQTWARINGENTLTLSVQQASEAVDDLLDSNSLSAQNHRDTITTAIKTAKDEKTKSFYEQFQHSDDENYLDMITQDQATAGEILNTLKNGGTYTLADGTVLTQDNISVVQEWYETVTEAATNAAKKVVELIETTEEKIDEILEDRADAIDKVNTMLERNADNIDYLLTMSASLWGENAAANQAYLYEQLQENTRAQISSLQDQLASQKEMTEYYQIQRDAYDKGSDEYNYWNEKLTASQETEYDTTQSLNDALQNLVDTARNLADAQASSAVDDVMKQIFGTNENGDSSLYFLSKEWELINDETDEYLDGVNRAYEIDKLRARYLEDLDNATAVEDQQKITAQMQEQLKLLNEKKNISKYDMEYANAYLDVMEKQMALQDAQNSKSKMRLKRDAQGNYSYQYVSDDEAVKNAQQELADATNELYNLVNDRYAELKDMSYSLATDLKQDIRDVIADTTLSSEEQATLVKELIAKYTEDMAALGEEAELCYDQLIESAKLSLNDFDISNEQLFAKLDDTVTMYLDENGTDSWLEIVKDFEKKTKEYLGTNGTLEKSVTDAIKNMNQTLSTVAGSQTTTDSNTINGQINNLGKNVEDAKTEVDKLATSLQGSEWLDQVKTAWETVKGKIDAAKEAAKQANSALNPTNTNNDDDDTGGNNNGGNTGGSNGGGNTGLTNETIDGVAGNVWVYGGWGTGDSRKNLINQKFGSGAYDTIQSYISKGMGALQHDWQTGYYKSYYPSAFKSGGYTGDWSDQTSEAQNGKLAWLHQKELVLNSTDTSNILAAVNMVRSMTDALQSIDLGSAIGSYINALSSMTQSEENPIEQNITINADFPAAESAAEIKEALESLSDRAAQYVLRAR